MQTLGIFLGMIVNTFIAFIFLWVVKYLDDRRTPFDEDELLMEHCNMAVALRKAGIYLGLAFGLYGVIQGPGKSLWLDATTIVGESIFLLGALFVAYLVNDHLVLRKVNNDEAVKNGNVAVGLVEFGSYIGTGLIINGAFSGEGGGLSAAIVFFIFGQAALFLVFYLYNMMNGSRICEQIENRGNVAAGISLSGTLIAFAIILRASIAGPFDGWAKGLLDFSFYLVAGLILLGLYSRVVNKLFLPKTTFEKEVYEDKNAASMVVSSGVIVALAMVIASAI